MKILILVLLIISQSVWSAPREIDDHHWVDVDRVVAIGDIHGDYEQYMATLEAAGLVNAKGKWIAGETHLVQTGDIPDRGPDTTRIIQHLQKLSKEAQKKGGRVHSLIGNHEAMNVYGDLRYVSAGEYQAFVTRNSNSLRDRYYNLVMQDLQQRDPEKFASLPENFREEWDVEHPLGWVEHRQSWDPAWNAEAEYAQWVTGNQVAIQVNDSIFLHGGISGKYCQNSLQSMTDMVVRGLQNYDPANSGILEDEYGPLWYRGLSGEEPVAPLESVVAILEHHNAARIVVGHTPTSGIVWPRYDGRLLQIDTGISALYGGHLAYLEITPEGLFAGYPRGKVAMPADESGELAYLKQVLALDPENRHLQNMQARLIAAQVAVEEQGDAAELAGADEGFMATDPVGEIEQEDAEPAYTLPICGISE